MDRHAHLRGLLEEVETAITVHACRPAARERMKEVRASLRRVRPFHATGNEAWLALWRMADELERSLGREDVLAAGRVLSDLMDGLALFPQEAGPPEEAAGAP
ncbi:MAG: hypothetical protein M3Y59_10735 [Myxococcota bacterium]|nr:hypothetical protein [Myxococcota bacterium]